MSLDLKAAAASRQSTTAADVSVIVVHHNRARLLLECLESLAVACARAGASTELIVIDNASVDETGAVVRKSFPSVRMVTLASNVGFAGGVNEGLARASGQWVLLLNNDTTVEPDAIRELLNVASVSEDVGAVGAQIRFAGRRQLINSAGLEIDQLGIAADRLVGRPIDASETAATEVFGVSAGAALYRRSMLVSIGGFDESFFAFLEDADVAWRARMAGWRSFYAPDAVVYHHHSATAGHGSEFKYRQVGLNRVRMLAKNARARQLWLYGPAMVGYDLAYVTFVLFTDRTLAPLRGRLAGVSQWRRYRKAGAGLRRSVSLAKPFGIRRALGRHKGWLTNSAPRRYHG